jgi:3-hydroxyisobutyrate dehydrogenase-like beta-hydroxyacid dehydrogenase
MSSKRMEAVQGREKSRAKPAEEAQPQLGFLGMGAMGSRLAGRLLSAGYPLIVYDRTPERTLPLVDMGARAVATPREVAADSTVVFSCLAVDAAVEAVLRGPAGAFAGARPGTVFVEMSTIRPATVRALAAAAQELGTDLIDAAISGSTPQVETGALVLLVGGDRGAYDRCAPVLAALTQRSYYMGPAGMGVAMKLVVNALLGVGMQALGEAIALGEKSGLDKEQLLDVLGETAVISPRQKLALNNVRHETYPVTFALRLMHKDYGLILREAAALQVPMPVTAAAQQMCAVELADRRQAAVSGEPDVDVTTTVRWMEELAGTAWMEASGETVATTAAVAQHR